MARPVDPTSCSQRVLRTMQLAPEKDWSFSDLLKALPAYTYGQIGGALVAQQRMGQVVRLGRSCYRIVSTDAERALSQSRYTQKESRDRRAVRIRRKAASELLGWLNSLSTPRAPRLMPSEGQTAPDPIPVWEDQHYSIPNWREMGLTPGEISGWVDEVPHYSVGLGTDLSDVRNLVRREAGPIALYRLDRELAGLSNDEPPQWEDAVLPSTSPWAALITARRDFLRYQNPIERYCIYGHDTPMRTLVSQCRTPKKKCLPLRHPHSVTQRYCRACFREPHRRLNHKRLLRAHRRLFGIGAWRNVGPTNRLDTTPL